MTEQLISFETAKLAKEKGLPQDDFYFENYEVRVPFYGLDNELNKGDEDRFGQCKSISQSLLQRWLREKYNQHIYLFPLDKGKWGFENNSISINLDYIFINYMYEGKEYNSYEEALEIGLQEALKLVNTKIVGNTKKLSEIIEEEKSFKITAPEPIEIDDLVISNVKERGVIPPNFYKKRRN